MASLIRCPDTFTLVPVVSNPIREAPDWNMLWSCLGCGGAHSWQNADLVNGSSARARAGAAEPERRQRPQ